MLKDRKVKLQLNGSELYKKKLLLRKELLHSLKQQLRLRSSPLIRKLRRR